MLHDEYYLPASVVNTELQTEKVHGTRSGIQFIVHAVSGEGRTVDKVCKKRFELKFEGKKKI